MDGDIRKKLCGAFCKYYKPSKKEDLACKGFLVVERLIRKGTRIPFDDRASILPVSTQETLIGNMCVSCPFYAEDCDFVQHRELPPCGGSGESDMCAFHGSTGWPAH